MVQATLEPTWIPDEICPVVCKIEKAIEKYATERTGKTTQFFELTLLADGQFYTYDAKYGDKTVLVQACGPDSDEWIGKRITVEKKGKYKTLSRA